MSYRPESHQLAGERAVRARDGQGRHAEHYDHHHPHATNTARRGAPASAPATRPPARPVGQVRLGRVAFWSIVGTLVVLAAWTMLSATYLAFASHGLGGEMPSGL